MPHSSIPPHRTIQQELAATTSKTARIEAIRKHDEGACIAALDRVSVRLQETILLEHAGTPEEREYRRLEVLRMGISLRTAMLNGGRASFEETAASWAKHELFDDFMRLLDHWLTRMPSNRLLPLSPFGT